MKGYRNGNDSRKYNQDVKTIEVNDSGNTITVNLGDISFTSNLLSLLQDFGEAAERISGKAAELSGTDPEKPTKLMELADFNVNVCNTLKQRVDDVLGPDTCKKVFGDGTPGMLSLSGCIGMWENISPICAHRQALATR